MRSSFVLATALVVLSSSLIAQQAEPQSKVPVFVTSESSAQGFTDPSKDRQDSIKDLEKKVRDSKTLAIASNSEEAVLIVEVLGRETKREVNGWTAAFGSAQNKSTLYVRMRAGEYSTEFSGESGSKGMMKGYGEAANKVVKEVETWVAANRSKLPSK